jgi:4-amino-4-deoxy-L-arabinose transferase-like glycosyltransferase
MKDFNEERPASETSAANASAVSEKSRDEILARAGLAALIAYSVVRSVIAAAAKPFWFDEICTWIIAHLSGPHEIWQALEKAADGQPPLFYLIESHFGNLASNHEIAFRIPSILAFACILIFTFAFARKRTTAANAVLCSALLLLTILFDTYAIEARPYSLEVACFALAILCYQHAPSTRWMLLMALSLALAENLHYYAVFPLVPFGAAEIAFTAKTRRFRLSVWLALICGCLPLLWLFPLLRALTQTYGQNLLAPASLVRAFAIYGWIFASHSNVVLVSALVIAAAAAILIAAAAVTEAFLKSPSLRSEWIADPTSHEQILALGFLALPFIAYAGAKIAHGALVDRYVLSMVLGVPLAASQLIPRLGKKNRTIFVAAIILLLAGREARFWISQDHHIAQPQFSWIRAQQMVNAAGHPDLPVAISSAVQYLELNHYAPPDLNRRLIFLADPPKAIEYDGSDSGDRQMLILRQYAPMQVEEFPQFKLAHREFLLLSNGDARLDWWPTRFRAEPSTELRALGTQGPWTIYLVNLAP